MRALGEAVMLPDKKLRTLISLFLSLTEWDSSKKWTTHKKVSPRSIARCGHEMFNRGSDRILHADTPGVCRGYA